MSILVSNNLPIPWSLYWSGYGKNIFTSLILFWRRRLETFTTDPLKLTKGTLYSVTNPPLQYFNSKETLRQMDKFYTLLFSWMKWHNDDTPNLFFYIFSWWLVSWNVISSVGCYDQKVKTERLCRAEDWKLVVQCNCSAFYQLGLPEDMTLSKNQYVVFLVSIPTRIVFTRNGLYFSMKKGSLLTCSWFCLPNFIFFFFVHVWTVSVTPWDVYCSQLSVSIVGLHSRFEFGKKPMIRSSKVYDLRVVRWGVVRNQFRVFSSSLFNLNRKN